MSRRPHRPRTPMQTAQGNLRPDWRPSPSPHGAALGGARSRAPPSGLGAGRSPRLLRPARPRYPLSLRPAGPDTARSGSLGDAVSGRCPLSRRRLCRFPSPCSSVSVPYAEPPWRRSRSVSRLCRGSGAEASRLCSPSGRASPGGSLPRGWRSAEPRPLNSQCLRWLCVRPQPRTTGKGSSPQHPRRQQLSFIPEQVPQGLGPAAVSQMPLLVLHAARSGAVPVRARRGRLVRDSGSAC